MPLPTVVTQESNKIATKSAWLVLLDVTLNDSSSTIFYITNNNEDVVFSGQTYSSLPFELDIRKDSLKGEIPSLNLRITNITRILMTYLEETSGAIGSSVLIRVVNSDLLSEDYSDLEMTFDVIGCSYGEEWIEFSLGAPNPLRSRFPLYRYIADKCRFVGEFNRGTGNRPRCKYAGLDTTCSGTLTDCESKSNQNNFGGFQGLQGGNVRIA